MGGIVGTEIRMPVVLEPKMDDTAIESKFSAQTEQYPPFQETQNGQNVENLQSLNETIDNNTDSFKGNTAIMKEFGDVMPEIIKNLRNMNSVVAQTTNNLPAVGKIKTSTELKKQRREEFDRQNFLNVFNTGSGALQSLSYGNVGGAGIGLISGASNAVSNYSKMANMEGLEGLGKGLLVGGTALAAAAAVFKGGKALSDAYKDAMPTIFNTGKSFGTTDNEKSMDLYKTVNRYNLGTNLDNQEFNKIVQDLRKQGVGNESKGPINQAAATAQLAETVGRWAYDTNGDVNQYARLAGLISRYGGNTDPNASFNRVMSTAKAAEEMGIINNAQIPEFLSGIEKVMEDGIAKGFSRSAEDVADTMLMFSKMSGNSAFWQGEKGAQMLNQMNQGVAGATSLSKTSDILTYQAFRNAYSGTIKDENGNEISKIQSALKYGKEDSTYIEGGGYVNMMQLIEQGVNANNFGSIMEAAKNAAGGDKNAETEFLRDIFGLNYTGAGRLQNLDWQNMSKEDLQKEIDIITKAPENQNNETRWKTDLNNIAQALESGGAKIFGEVTLPGMDMISKNVKSIADYVTGTPTNTNIELGESADKNENVNSVVDVPKMIEEGKTEEEINEVTYDNNVADNDLFGYSLDSGAVWNLKKGIGRNNKKKIDEYIRRDEYGDYIKDTLFKGDEDAANQFINVLLKSKMAEAQNVRGKVEWETSDTTVFKEERDQTRELIKALYDVVVEVRENGFVINDKK